MRARSYLVLLALVLTTVSISQKQVNSAKAVEASTDKELTRLGLTSEKLERLKSIGLDLRTAWIRHERETELSEAAVSDIVVVGVPLCTQDLPAPRGYPFHSRVLVRVVESLKGAASVGDTLRFLRQSGPLAGEHLMIVVSDEIEMKNGERAVIFAQIPSKNTYLRAVFPGYFVRGEFRREESEYWADFHNVHKIDSGKVNFQGVQKNISEVARNVRRVAEVLQ
jgi:hypothetical protein